ncbi:alpha-glucosidase [Verticillium dahliae]|nr:alpha-glucosidase [Verticillium dahliae]
MAVECGRWRERRWRPHDFTSEAGFNWWYEGYTVTSDDWECALDQDLHTEQHAKASHDALLEVNPDERPFVLMRSATAGAMRYGPIGFRLTLASACCTATGTKLAGEGPQPSPVLLRWVQPRIYSPRFVINCFKTGSDNSSLEPLVGGGAYFLGDSLLVGGHLAAGQWVDVDAEWHGAGIPVLGKDNVANLPLDDYRAVEVFPLPGAPGAAGGNETTWYEDDGVMVVTKNKVSSHTIGYTATVAGIRVRFARSRRSGRALWWYYRREI